MTFQSEHPEIFVLERPAFRIVLDTRDEPDKTLGAWLAEAFQQFEEQVRRPDTDYSTYMSEWWHGYADVADFVCEKFCQLVQDWGAR